MRNEDSKKLFEFSTDPLNTTLQLKNQSIAYRKLIVKDMVQLHQSYLETFSGYPVDMSLDKKAFRQRMLDRLNLDFNISIGAFHGQKLVGFLLHTLNTYGGSPVAYNGGTGVIPAYRGGRISQKMYSHLLEGCQTELKADKIMLEVLVNNAPARRIYEICGFKQNRLLKCYKQCTNYTRNPSALFDVEIQPWSNQVPEKYYEHCTFMDSPAQLHFNKTALRVIVAKDNQNDIGYLVGDVQRARVSLLYILPEQRGQGVATSLLNKMKLCSGGKKLSFLNVDEQLSELHQFLSANGFENEFDQIEMEKSL